MSAKLVIVQGIPGSGKTTLSNQLAQEMPELILIQKDTIKELLFDTVGIRDEEWSRLLGKAATDAVLAITRVFLSGGQHVMLESAFYAQLATPDIVALKVPVLELYCECDDMLRIERYVKRAATTRHPGHHQVSGKFDPSIYAPLQIGEVIHIDMANHIGEAELQKIKDKIRRFLENKE